jgi:hypothetical protein
VVRGAGFQLSPTGSAVVGLTGLPG